MEIDMSSIKTLLLAGCLALFALFPAGAQTFHELYGHTYQFGELTSVASTSLPGAIASGSFNVGGTQGVLLKILPTGKPAWVRAYGPTELSAARERPAGGFAWIGTGESVHPQGFTPVVAGVDLMGMVLWSRAIRVALPDGSPADHAYGRFLEIDPKDGGYWVRGELWSRTADDPQPWFGKLDSAGNLMWAKTLAVSGNARFFSIFPAFDGGIIGVGQRWAQDDPGRNHAAMLAIKLGPGGDLVWGSNYRVQNAEIGEQRLSDLDRDPRYTRAESVVVGTVAAFCKSVPSLPCDPVESVAFVAILDETTGKLSQARGLFSTSRPKTFGETVVMDLPGETTAVGGEIAGNEPGSRQGLLALLTPGASFVRTAMTHGAGRGFDVDVRSLDRWQDATGSGYLFATNESFAEPRTVPTLLRSLVRTDRDGRSGSCEQCTEVKTFEAWPYDSEVQLELISGRAEPFAVEAVPVELVDKPCTEPCSGP